MLSSAGRKQRGFKKTLTAPMQWYRLCDQSWEEADEEENGAIQLELSWFNDPPGYQRCMFRKAKQNAKGKKKEKKDPRAGRRKKGSDRPPQKGETPAERRERMAEFNEIQELEMAVMNDGVAEGDYQIQVREGGERAMAYEGGVRGPWHMRRGVRGY
jgi:hypothetical protein